MSIASANDRPGMATPIPGDRSGTRRPMRRRSARLKRALPYLLVGPAVVYLLAITLYPGIFAVYQSLYVVRFVNWTFTGLGNYEQLLTDREFWAALGNTAVIGGISLVLLRHLLHRGLALPHHLAHPFDHIVIKQRFE
mgnify:CR=1 FL=1